MTWTKLDIKDETTWPELADGYVLYVDTHAGVIFDRGACPIWRLRGFARSGGRYCGLWWKPWEDDPDLTTGD